jgi:uncharacterized protein YfeS
MISCLLSADGQSTGKSIATKEPKNNSTNVMNDFEFTFKSAHPNAQKLMTEEFYWSPIEETAPFGSDDGSDAAYGFIQWRHANKTASPVTYLNELISSWGYPYFDYNEIDTNKIKEYLSTKNNLDEETIQQQIKTLKETFKNDPDTSMGKLNDSQLREIINSTSNNMGIQYLVGQDNAIIAVGFAQFVLEGRIANDIRALTITAIKRQLLPVLIGRWDAGYQEIRKQQLTKMLEVVKKASS